MIFRPIINQSKFPSTKRDPTFYIRSKKSQSKIKNPLFSLQSQKSIKNLPEKKALIEQCLQQLKNSLQEQKVISQKLFKTIEKFLREILFKKDQYKEQKCEKTQRQYEFDDFQPQSLKKSLSKVHFKSNVEIMKIKQNFMDSINLNSNSQSPYQPKIKKHTKFKTAQKFQDKKYFDQMMRQWESKNAKFEDELKAKDRQIQILRVKVQQSQTLKLRAESKIKQLKRLFEESQRQNIARISQLQYNSQQLLNAKNIILAQLKQRQAELLCLWRYQVQFKLP